MYAKSVWYVVFNGFFYNEDMISSELVQRIQETVPAWPKTKVLEYNHQALLHDYFSYYPSLVSEFSFSGLFLFKQQYHYSLTRVDNHLYIVGKDTERAMQFLHIIARIPPINFLYDFFSQNRYIKIVPLSLFRSMNRALLLLKDSDVHATMVEERGDFDYLYRTHDLAELRGSKFHKKRNHVNYFKEHYQYTTKIIEKDTLNDAYHILNIWKQQQSNVDYEAITTAISHFFDLPLFGRITYIQNTPVAFVMAEYRNNQKAVIVHFEKADMNYKGVYQYINQDFAAQLPSHCYLINREQDLGEEGLRKAKQTYRPVMLLKKYRVFPI